jgi:hypothetical protein
MLSVVMLIVIIRNAVMLSVLYLSVFMSGPLSAKCYAMCNYVSVILLNVRLSVNYVSVIV